MKLDKPLHLFVYSNASNLTNSTTGSSSCSSSSSTTYTETINSNNSSSSGSTGFANSASTNSSEQITSGSSTSSDVTANPTLVNDKNLSSMLSVCRLSNLDYMEVITKYDPHISNRELFLTSTERFRHISRRNILNTHIDQAYKPLKNSTGPISHHSSDNKLTKRRLPISQSQVFPTTDAETMPTKRLRFTTERKEFVLKVANLSDVKDDNNKIIWGKVTNLVNNEYKSAANASQIKNLCNKHKEVTQSNCVANSSVTAPLSSSTSSFYAQHQVNNDNFNQASEIDSTPITELDSPNLTYSTSACDISIINNNSNNNSDSENNINSFGNNNSQHSYDDIRNVQLPVSQENLQFSQLENEILNEAVKDPKYKNNGGKGLSWSSVENRYEYLCKKTKLERPECVLYIRNARQLQNRFKHVNKQSKKLN